MKIYLGKESKKSISQSNSKSHSFYFLLKSLGISLYKNIFNLMLINKVFQKNDYLSKSYILAGL